MKVPPALLESLRDVKGFNKDAFENVHQSGEQVTSLRLNDKKLQGLSGPFMPGVMDGQTPALVPWCSNGYYLSARPSFTADPLFHAGAYYVQEASSMFLEEVLKQSVDLSRPLKVLDLCAAPGGKSTLMQTVLSDKSLLVSNELIKNRVTVLTENIIKWGAANVIVTNNEPKDFQRLPGYFDIIVVDAPCSGSGLFRKDPLAISEWSAQQVELCSRRQQSIIADILPALKEDGILIYSTCSFSKEEDEDIGDWLIDKHRLSAIRYQLKDEWSIVETSFWENNSYGYRFYPDKLKGEGFFIAAFKKGETGDDRQKLPAPKRKPAGLSSKEIEVAKKWLKEGQQFFYIRQNQEVIAIPLHLENDLVCIQSALYIKKAGIKLGAIIRGELIPAHELALSGIIKHDVSAIDVDKETALQYLRRQEIDPGAGINGWALITYHRLPLGWVKVLPNRVNNYYPKEWRILNK